MNVIYSWYIEIYEEQYPSYIIIKHYLEICWMYVIVCNSLGLENMSSSNVLQQILW